LIESKVFEAKLDALCPDLFSLLSTLISSPIATPCMSAAANYYKSLKTDYLPINLIQAQRDYFGAHTYKRVDSPDISRHSEWKN